MARHVPEGLTGYSALQTIWTAMQSYVASHGGKIDTIKLNDVTQPIVDKEVNLNVQTKIELSATTPSTQSTGDFWYKEIN